MSALHEAEWFSKHAKDSEKAAFERIQQEPPHVVAREPAPGRVLTDVVRFVRRFVAFSSDAQAVAVALWVIHAHLVECFDSSPRLALLSPEAGSGKTRTLEVIELLAPNPMHALNANAAPLFRSIKSKQPTLLLDEVDAIFTKRGKDDSAEDLRALLNAGHRKGATIPRCVGSHHDVEQFPVDAAVALAGLGDLPETLMTRSVIIRMRKRAPSEEVESFRHRLVAPDGNNLRARIAEWADDQRDTIGNAWPLMPEGVTDRPADCWEPLLAVADAMGGQWPDRARRACVELCKVAATREASLDVRLLGDIREVFGDDERLSTDELLKRLVALEEAPWADLRGRPLDARGLARRLHPYDITSTKVKFQGESLRGYQRDDFYDAWSRYLAPDSGSAEPAEPTEPGRSEALSQVPLALTVPEPESRTEPDTRPATCTVPEVPEVPDLQEPEPEDLGAHTSDTYDGGRYDGVRACDSASDDLGERTADITYDEHERARARACEALD